MRLTHYGKDVIVKVFIAGLILILVSIFVQILLLKIFFISLAVFLWLFTLYFFRDPERLLPSNLKDNQIISPADGKIVLIEDVVNAEENIFDIGENLKQISIFLSPLNVHVNRIPVDGVVKFFRYVKGDYIVAFDHKASERNERTEIGIESPTGKKLIFKQIAGFVARRIVCTVQKDSSVHVGERFGMIKFGSRADILIKRNSEIKVSINQNVIGGETIIAEL